MRLSLLLRHGSVWDRVQAAVMELWRIKEARHT